MVADDLAKQAKAESPPLQSEPDSKPLGVPALARFQSRGHEQTGKYKQTDGSNDNKSKPETNKSKPKVRTFSNKKNPSGRASSFDNAITAIDQLVIVCRYDVFHDRMLVSGHPLQIATMKISIASR